MNSDDLIIFVMLGSSFVFTGAIAYALSGRALRGPARVRTSLIAAVLVGLTSVYVPWLPFLAFLATAAAFLVMRRLLKPAHALAASGVILLGGLSFAVLLMVSALNTM